MTSLTFLGATGQVTGSCYLLETGSSRLLLDCGLFQGSKETEKQNGADFPFDPSGIDAVVLSHAHLDHCGRLPKLVKDGFKGKVFLTEASFHLLELMLTDAVHLQLRDTEWENKRRQRAGKKLLEPLYELEDVEALLKLLGSEVNVAARIHTLGALSAHADQSQLLRWASNFKTRPRLYLIHGEKTAALSLQTCFHRTGWHAEIPRVGEKITL